uniref:Uncharacterized protein n=1 Tax=Tanacetum cinerariifolium TaxID=118510 RepID=A0A699HM35_TANCI|nr:hypothetical protein [Tanacetum cinerariifolium]
MERKLARNIINKADCDTDSEDNDRGDAHQDPNTSHLEANAREVVDKNVVELSELNAIEPKEEVDMKKEVGDRTNDEPVRNMEDKITRDRIEELVKIPRSQPVGYYLKH